MLINKGKNEFTLKRKIFFLKKVLTISIFQYNTFAFERKKCPCRHRLVVRTPGFHPGNRGSIPRGDTIYITRGGEVVSRRAHNPKITGSIPVPATK